MAAHRLLLLDGLARRRRGLCTTFKRRGWIVSAFDNVAEGLEALAQGPEPCCLIVPLEPALRDGRGEAALERSVAMGYRTRLVVCSGNISSIRRLTTSEYRRGHILPQPLPLDELWGDRCPVCEGRNRSRDPPPGEPDNPVRDAAIAPDPLLLGFLPSWSY